MNQCELKKIDLSDDGRNSNKIDKVAFLDDSNVIEELNLSNSEIKELVTGLVPFSNLKDLL